MTQKEFLQSLKPKGTYTKTDFTKYVELSAGKIRAALLNKTPEYLLPIFNLIEDKDSSIGSEVEKRALSVKNKEYTTSLSDKYISSIYDIISASLEAKLFGIAVLELYLDENLDFAFRQVDREYFSYREGKVYLMAGRKEFVAKEPRFIVIEKKPVLIKTIWIVFAKHFVLSHYLKFAEFLGVPPLIGHSHSSDEKIIEHMTDAMKNLKSGSYGVFGTEDVIKILEGRGTQADFMEFVSYADTEIAKVINGQSLSSNTGKSGSYALGKVHENNRKEIINSDIKDANFYVNYLFNKVGIKADFKIPLLKDIGELSRANTLQILNNMGISGVPETIAEEFGLTLDTSTPTLSKNSKTKILPMDKIEKSIKNANFKHESQDIENTINKLINECATFQEIYEKILELYPSVDFEAIEASLQKVIANAHMEGHDEL